MDINEEIKKESEKFEIHSTSKMILARYLTEKKSELKKRKHFWLPFGLSLGTVAVAALSTFLAIRFTPKPNSDGSNIQIDYLTKGEKYTLNDSSLLSQTGIDLFFGSQMNRKQSLPSDKKASFMGDIAIGVQNKEEHVKNTYSSLFGTIDLFLETDNSFSLSYGTTTYIYDNETYHYVLLQGENRVYTQNDIREGVSINQAIYVMDGNIYKGCMYVNNDEDEQSLKCVFVNGTRSITIFQESDEDGHWLYYQAMNQEIFLPQDFDIYRISVDFLVDGQEKDSCNLIHNYKEGSLQTTTLYDRKEKTYEVSFLEMTYSPSLSYLETDFVAKKDDFGRLNYTFPTNN